MKQTVVMNHAKEAYEWAIKEGVAKEQQTVQFYQRV